MATVSLPKFSGTSSILLFWSEVGMASPITVWVSITRFSQLGDSDNLSSAISEITRTKISWSWADPILTGLVVYSTKINFNSFLRKVLWNLKPWGLIIEDVWHASVDDKMPEQFSRQGQAALFKLRLEINVLARLDKSLCSVLKDIQWERRFSPPA